jgi:hypothetical protein
MYHRARAHLDNPNRNAKPVTDTLVTAGDDPYRPYLFANICQLSTANFGHVTRQLTTSTSHAFQNGQTLLIL